MVFVRKVVVQEYLFLTSVLIPIFMKNKIRLTMKKILISK